MTMDQKLIKRRIKAAVNMNLKITESEALLLSKALRKMPVTEATMILSGRVDAIYADLRRWPPTE